MLYITTLENQKRDRQGMVYESGFDVHVLDYLEIKTQV